MARMPVAIRQQPVPGGVELIAVGRTERGTRYYMDSIVVLGTGLDKEADKDAIAKAVVTLLGDDYPTR